jgi:hypothetical protein
MTAGMLRSLPESDEFLLIGASDVAWLPIPAATLAQRVGIKLRTDDDFAPGLGTFEFFTCEIDDSGVVFTIASGERTPQFASIITHSVADLPIIIGALGVDPRVIDAVVDDPPKPWHVVRQDKDGKRVVLHRCQTRRQAELAANGWTRRIDPRCEAIHVEFA